MFSIFISTSPWSIRKKYLKRVEKMRSGNHIIKNYKRRH